MIQRNQRALTAHSIAQRRRVRPADELRPESMYGLRECLNERVRDVTQERGARVEVRQREPLELESFTTEVCVHESDDLSLSDVRGAVARAGDERLEVTENR